MLYRITSNCFFKSSTTLFLLLLFLSSNASLKVLNGTAAGASTYGYAVSLQVEGKHFCGASIIDSTWLITAAHCLDGKYLNSITAVAGTLVLSDTSTAIKGEISQMLVHPEYDPYMLQNDLALLQLAQPIAESNNIAYLAVITDEMVENSQADSAYVLGWGRYKQDGQYPDSLQEGKVAILPNEYANRKDIYNNSISNCNIAAADTCLLIDACDGDSGGPLIINGENGIDYLIGITSWGESCAQKGKPGIYTRISCYKKWIESVRFPADAAFSITKTGTAASPIMALAKSTEHNTIEWELKKNDALVYSQPGAQFEYLVPDTGTYTLHCESCNTTVCDTFSAKTRVYEQASCQSASNPPSTGEGSGYSSENSLGIFQSYSIVQGEMLELYAVCIKLQELPKSPAPDLRLYLDVYDSENCLQSDFLHSYTECSSFDKEKQAAVLHFSPPIQLTDSFRLEIWYDEFYDQGLQLSVAEGNSARLQSSGYISTDGQMHRAAVNASIGLEACMYRNEKPGQQSEMELYPTATKEYIRISARAPIGRVQVLSMQGSVLLEQYCNTANAKLNLSSLHNGYYIVSMGEQTHIVLKN